MTISRAGTAARIALISATCAGAFLFAVPVTSCGSSDPHCGDGTVNVEGEQCDDGNNDDTDFCRNNCTVRLPKELTIKWEFNKGAVEGFSNDSCTDMGAFNVEVEVTGPVTETKIETCPLRQVVFEELPAGTYVVKLTPMNFAEESIVNAPLERTIMLGDASQEIEMIVRPEDWANQYTGTFFFRLRWGGFDCSAANPPVTQHRLLLQVGGVTVAQITQDGDPLDGSATGPCQSITEEFPQSALDVPFGYAQFPISGYDSGDQKQFEETVDTFVGAGISNPELVFDVDSLFPDAGVPDAGVSDAGVPDAAVTDAAPSP